MQTRNSPAVGTEVDRSGVSFALQASLTRTVDAIMSDSIAAGHDATADDYLLAIGKVIDLIASRMDSSTPPASMSIPFGLSAIHLELLRVQFIGAIAEAESQTIDSAHLVAALVTLEELAMQVRLGAQNQFVDRLSAPDALQAVIEVAHDMRAPLGSILFLVDAIRLGQSGPVNLVQERQLGLIYGAALGLSNIACDVVDAVRGNRLVDGRPRPFSIEEVLNSVHSIVRPIGEEKQLAIKVILPRAGGRLGYPAALHRILLNLLSNAMRYTDVGSVTIGCDEPTDSTVRFWVEDTGSGIPPSVMSMIYDGFRPTSIGSRFSSAGLGLAICRTLLSAMGSTLAIETSVRGTKFSFELEMDRAR